MLHVPQGNAAGQCHHIFSLSLSLSLSLSRKVIYFITLYRKKNTDAERREDE